MNLAEVPAGKKVRVLKVGGLKEIKQRMLDMGVMPTTEIQVERYAPLCDPIHIKLKGYSLALRVSEGKNIEVEYC